MDMGRSDEADRNPGAILTMMLSCSPWQRLPGQVRGPRVHLVRLPATSFRHGRSQTGRLKMRNIRRYGRLPTSQRSLVEARRSGRSAC